MTSRSRGKGQKSLVYDDELEIELPPRAETAALRIQNIANYNAAPWHARIGCGEKLRLKRHENPFPSKVRGWATFRFITDIYLVLWAIVYRQVEGGHFVTSTRSTGARIRKVKELTEIAQPPAADEAAAVEHPASAGLAFLLLITSVAALGGLLFGYDTAVISGAIGSVAGSFRSFCRRNGMGSKFGARRVCRRVCGCGKGR